jgi:K(+)-stimulated pyrophosphate-energized sodium pump
LFIGGMIPVVFSALAMNSVGKAAMDMVYEVRRQFKEIPGIMEGTGKPEYGKCVEISTKAALREMMLPGILTIGFPIAIVLLGKLVYPEDNQLIAEMLGGYMAGVTVSGVLWAVFQNNAGGAWDNAKKSFEAGVMINGEMTYKGSDAHKAAVTGDTVGDPFKDTSGPSMNILIKLTCLIGLVIAPILGGDHVVSEKLDAVEMVEHVLPPAAFNREFSVEKTNVDGKVTAVVTISTATTHQAPVVKVENLEGTEAEVDAKIEELKRD